MWHKAPSLRVLPPKLSRERWITRYPSRERGDARNLLARDVGATALVVLIPPFLDAVRNDILHCKHLLVLRSQQLNFR